MAICTLLTFLLSAITVFGRNIPVQMRDLGTDVIRTSRKLSDLPPVDMGGAFSSGPSLGQLNFTQHRSHVDEENATLAKRTQITNTATLGAIECITPASGATPDTDDCSRVCAAITGYTSPVMIGPLEIEEWSVGFCTLGVANLQPCDTLDIDPLSLFASACEHMNAQCVANGYDAIVFSDPPPFAISLYGRPAAPPYQEQPC